MKSEITAENLAYVMDKLKDMPQPEITTTIEVHYRVRWWARPIVMCAIVLRRVGLRSLAEALASTILMRGIKIEKMHWKQKE